MSQRKIVVARDPIYVAKALEPIVDPTVVLVQIVEDNDGYIGGTIRYGSSGSAGSELGSQGGNGSDGVREKFSFGDLIFNVDEAKDLCAGVPNDEIEVSPLWSYKINVDRVAALKSGSDQPVIVAQIPTSKGLLPLLIDGHHRMYKALYDGKETLPAYLLSPEDSLELLETHPDMMTTLTQCLRDISPTQPTMTDLEKISKIWHGIIAKAQPTTSEVHVKGNGNGQGSTAPSVPRKRLAGNAAEEEEGEDGNVSSVIGTPGWDTPPENNQDVGVEKAASGIMVCLYLPASVAAGLALPDGEPSQDLHVTLAYIPGVGGDADAFRSITRCLENVANQFAPVLGRVGGSGLFAASENSDGKDVYYASFNSPILPALQAAVVSALDWGGISIARTHGFTPHITLKYVEPGSGALGLVTTEPFKIPSISIASKTLPREDIPFTGTRIMKSEEDPAVTLALWALEKELSDTVMPIFKADEMKQVAYCVVLEPDIEDQQEDVITAQEIEKTAHDYMENSRLIGRRHRSIQKGACPVESYIAPQDLFFDGGPYGPSTVIKGSWVIGMKIPDPAEWAKVVSGEYKGVSVGGQGVRD